MIEAVLWDNDGVLVDSEILFFETTRKAFTRLGLELTPETWGRQYLGEGKSSREVAALLGVNGKKVAEVLNERDEDYMRVLR
jgi:beta-phosphoglucomutase-like phosphatase (HAD superfamily)